MTHPELPVKETALPAGGKPYQTMAVSRGISHQMPPLRMIRLQSIHSFLRIVDDRYGHSTSLPTPMDFGVVKLMALYCELKQAQVSGKDDSTVMDELKTKAMAVKAPVEIMIIKNAGHNWRKVGADIEPSLEVIIKRTVQFFVDHFKMTSTLGPTASDE